MSYVFSAEGAEHLLILNTAASEFRNKFGEAYKLIKVFTLRPLLHCAGN